MTRVTFTADRNIYVGILPWWRKLWNLVRYGKPNGRPENPFATLSEALDAETWHNIDLNGYTLTVNTLDGSYGRIDRIMTSRDFFLSLGFCCKVCLMAWWNVGWIF